VAVYCFTQPIQPGKREEAKRIFEEIEASGSEHTEEVAEYVRGVLMPFIVDEQGWAVLSEGAPVGE
jgi:hypothetical protein